MKAIMHPSAVMCNLPVWWKRQLYHIALFAGEKANVFLQNLRLKTNYQPDKGQVCLERTVVSGQTDIRSKLDQTWKVKGWKVALTLEESLDFPKQFQKAQFLILPISYPEAFMSRCAVIKSTQSSDVWKPV